MYPIITIFVSILFMFIYGIVLNAIKGRIADRLNSYGKDKFLKVIIKAKRIKIASFIFAFCGPLPLGLLATIPLSSFEKDILLTIILVIISVSLIFGFYWMKVEKIAKSIQKTES